MAEQLAAALDRIIRFRELQRMIGLSRGWVFILERERKFPQRLKIGPNSVGWRESEILAWIESRPRANLGGGGEDAA